MSEKETVTTERGRFEALKAEVLRRAEACHESYADGLAAESMAELCKAIKAIFTWAAGNRVIDSELIGRYRKEFAACDIYANTDVSGNAYAVCDGDGEAVAWDNAYVVALDNASVDAWDNASVEAYDNASVEAWDNASVEAWDNASVEAYNCASVLSYERKNVKVHDMAVYKIRNERTIVCAGNREIKIEE